MQKVMAINPKVDETFLSGTEWRDDRDKKNALHKALLNMHQECRQFKKSKQIYHAIYTLSKPTSVTLVYEQIYMKVVLSHADQHQFSG